MGERNLEAADALVAIVKLMHEGLEAFITVMENPSTGRRALSFMITLIK